MEIYDPCEKGSSESCGEVSSEESHATEAIITKKTCADCGTTKTPLWRGGPAGPKSLCNACGIRSRKRRRAIMDGAEEIKRPKKASSSGSSSDRSSNKYGAEWLKEVLKQRSSFERQRIQQQQQLGEEEQAAVLLMALSCGAVYA